MKSFIAFFKKEILECIRSGKLTVLCILFAIFGIMNPAIAKLTPWMVELLSGSLAENGMLITGVTVTALTSWTQFFKNIKIALFVFVLIYSGIFTKEYQSGTLTLILTKGLSRYKVMLAKFVVMLTIWTFGYWLCFVVTYGYNAYFWDNSIAIELIPAAVCWWLFGVWIVCLIVLFSALSKSHTGVLLGTGGSVLGVYLIGLLPEIRGYTPIALLDNTSLLTGAESVDIFTKAVCTTMIMCFVLIVVSIPVMNRKQVS